jgi:EAL domain-containing protein (putative c-di-GMP-specific phosphodiesterase class I)
MAEETRLILPSSNWVLQAACRDYAEWLRVAPDTAPKFISINLSARQLLKENLADMFIDVLHEFGLKPCQLQLELTKANIVAHYAAATSAMKAITKTGIRLAIDDFRTGYSSLACLQQFPFSQLKMDHIFVASVGDGNEMFRRPVYHLIHRKPWADMRSQRCRQPCPEDSSASDWLRVRARQLALHGCTLES